jgi:hypothetical protein
MAGVHAQSLSIIFFICLYLSAVPKDQPTVDRYHSHLSTTTFTCPVLPLFNHLITIVNMQHSLVGQPEDVCKTLPVYQSAPHHILVISQKTGWNLRKHCRENLNHPQFP